MLVQLLLHEVPVAVLADAAPVDGDLDLALDRRRRGSKNGGVSRSTTAQSPSSQVGDAAGHRRQRQAVAAEIHVALAEADRERRAVLGADQRSGWPANTSASA